MIQKSLREGFGLTVTEALWKEKPTIAGAVGGIPNQIIHQLTGVLVHSVEGCAFQIRDLLTHPEFARRIGMDGREHVRENFLITSDVKRWLLLFRTLCGRSRREPRWTRQPERQFLHRAHVADFPVIPSELPNSPSLSLSTGQTKESDIKRNGNQKSR